MKSKVEQSSSTFSTDFSGFIPEFWLTVINYVEFGAVCRSLLQCYQMKVRVLDMLCMDCIKLSKTLSVSDLEQLPSL